MKNTLLIILLFVCPLFAQTEVLTNAEIIEMTKADLGKELIIDKIKTSNAIFDISTRALIELKKSNVAEEIISLMLEKSKAKRQRFTQTEDKKSEPKGFSESEPNTNFGNNQTALEMLQNAKTITIKKSSLHPTKQNLEKELLKHKDWVKFNLKITEYQETADLSLEIGRVAFTVFTHRYVFRIVDSRSGTIIAAGETTSWGSLAENMARNILKELNKIPEVK